MERQDQSRQVARTLSKFTKLIALLVLGWVILAGLLLRNPYPILIIENNNPPTASAPSIQTSAPVMEEDQVEIQDPSTLEPNPYNDMVRYGRDLIHETSLHIGPLAKDPSKVYAGNDLACTNCHLEDGTKDFAAPYIGVTGLFPNYRKREGQVGSIEERINGCMQRSMNGNPIPTDSREMRAMVTYMTYISAGVKVGKASKGRGMGSIALPDRAVDLEAGRTVYKQFCATCHQEDGQGLRNSKTNLYTYPPLWGDDSYNEGAGMHRVITAAQFIKNNMPLGATHDSPILSDEQAYDVAGYINSHKRPTKTNLAQDFPNKLQKPMSTPYGPWQDEFTAEQHKYGPFTSIQAYYKTEYGITKQK